MRFPQLHKRKNVCINRSRLECNALESKDKMQHWLIRSSWAWIEILSEEKIFVYLSFMHYNKKCNEGKKRESNMN